MSLYNVQHQAYAQRLIQKAVRCQRVPHAYAFHGPDGVGKEMLASGLAELWLCSAPVDRELTVEKAQAVGVSPLRTGCNRCEDCRAVAAGTHPDLHLVNRRLNRDHPDPAVRKRKALELGVDVVRHFIIERVGLTPVLGRAKVFIIPEADRMTVQAQNALLKTLEEPPGATYIILLVRAIDRLLPTTLSRCQVVRFDSLPMEFILNGLAELVSDLPAPQRAWYARHSDGSLGDALQAARDQLYEVNERLGAGFMEMCGRRAHLPNPPALVKAWTDESKRLGVHYRKRDPDITETEATRRGFKSIFRLLATCYADLLRFGSGNEQEPTESPPGVHADSPRPEGRGLSSPAAIRLNAEQAAGAINRIAGAERQLDLNANPQMCVETLVNDLARIASASIASTA